MPKDLELVLARYSRSVHRKECPRRADGDATKQAENYARSYVERSTTETMVREVLMESGISTIFIVHYLNFGRRMARLAARYAGESLKLEATNATAEWTRKGLSPYVLAAICRTVFNVRLDRPAL
jgi:hypothetical protein